MESYNSFRVAQRQILDAAKMLNLDEPTTMLLSLPQREFNFTLHVKMDSGKVKIFQATVCNIILPGDLQKAESGFIPKRLLIQ